MRKILISSALAASLAIPSLALNVYDSDDTKVDLYGSLRGYAGGSQLNTPNPGEVGITKGENSGGYLVGLQNNSFFGTRVSHGNFKANIEFGWIEGTPTTVTALANPGLRLAWGSYTTSAGEILFGKANTPSTDTGFSSNWLNNDNGFMGFGGVATGDRVAQLQYNVAGLSIALVSDNYLAGAKVAAGLQNTNINEGPRISFGYTIKGEKGAPFFKIAGNYKHISSDSKALYNSTRESAWDIWAGIRPTFGNAYVSVLVNHGIDADLYLAQRTMTNLGGYGHNAFDIKVNTGTQDADGNDIMVRQSATRTGGLLEFGLSLNENLSLALGAGYQTTSYQTTKDKVNAFTGFINLPYKVSQNFTFVPQVAYYNVSGDPKEAEKFTLAKSVVAAVRIKWDF